MTQVVAYNVCIHGRNGEEYICTVVECPPAFSDIKHILEYEVDGLKKDAHILMNQESNPDTNYRIGRTWNRVEELTRLISFFNLSTLEEPKSLPYNVTVMLGGQPVGTIAAIPVPVYRI